jgi:hypothetical protein
MTEQIQRIYRTEGPQIIVGFWVLDINDIIYQIERYLGQDEFVTVEVAVNGDQNTVIRNWEQIYSEGVDAATTEDELR